MSDTYDEGFESDNKSDANKNKKKEEEKINVESSDASSSENEFDQQLEKFKNMKDEFKNIEDVSSEGKDHKETQNLIDHEKKEDKGKEYMQEFKIGDQQPDKGGFSDSQDSKKDTKKSQKKTEEKEVKVRD